MRTKRLIDVYDNPLINGGLFTILNTLSVPWSEDIDGDTLDAEYFYNISGQKTISPLVRRVLHNEETLTSTQKGTLANLIYNMCHTYWSKEYETLLLEYNPIANYEMTESETVAKEDTRERSNTGTQTNSGSQSVNTTTTGTSENNIYGFNSVDAVGDSTSETGGTVSTTGTDSNTRTDNLSEEESGTDSIERTLTRSGNIGVTTSQQMLEAERLLWLWNFFYNVVFPDIDKILTVSTYHR